MGYNKLGLTDGQVLKAMHLDYIEEGISKAFPTINSDSSTNINLVDNTEFRRGTVSSLNIDAPILVPEELNCTIAFTSGSPAANVIIPEHVALLHTSKEFVAEANTRYNLLFWSDGEKIWCSVASTPV